jgi:hypothetical protein
MGRGVGGGHGFKVTDNQRGDNVPGRKKSIVNEAIFMF